jgi:uncharacterized oxidoreductase
MSGSPKVVDHIRLREIMELVFRRLHVPEEEVQIIAETLMEATLAGYPSHGIMRVPRYVEGIRRGDIVPGAVIEVLEQTATTARLDAHHAPGPVSAARAVNAAVAKAAETGAGVVTVVNGNDVARLGSYLERPSRDGYVVLMMANDAGGNPAVAPWGGAQPFLSTNPIAAGIPRAGGAPIIIDMSTAVASEGQVRMRRNRGERVPPGWLVDENGETITDPGRYWAAPKKAALMPLGGMLAGHKGFALGVLVEALAGALSGAGCSAGITNLPDRNGLFVLALDPEKFGSRAVFLQHIDRFVSGVKQVRTIPGMQRISLPGEGAARNRKQNIAGGIDIDTVTWKQLQEIMTSLSITGFHV